MPTHYRSFLIVVLAGAFVLLVARKFFAPLMMSNDDFRRRRNLWLVITASAFLIPSFWAYALVAMIAILYATRHDSNPAALYPLLLVVIPPLEAAIPGLVPISHQRMLVLVVLLPMLRQLFRDPQVPGVLKLPTDKFVLAYFVLQVILTWPYVTAAHAVRLAFFFVVDLWLPYYLMSRAFTSREQLRDAMACFVLSLVVVVPMTFGEMRLGTLLYGGFGESWNIGGLFGYTTRGDWLRAQMAAGQPIVLGYQFAVAIGMWLYLQRHVESVVARRIVMAALTVGLLTTISRGPWVGAAVAFVAFALVSPQNLGRLAQGVAAAAVLFALVLATPWGSQLADYLPFVGNAAQETVDYRREWLNVSWQLIQQSPFFGDLLVMRQLEFMRTGEGIIDIVNTYVALALIYGGVGVALFIGIFVTAMVPLMKIVRNPRLPEDLRYLGASVLACLLGVLVMIGTVSNYLTIPQIYMMLIGLAISCSRVMQLEPSTGSLGSMNTFSASTAWRARRGNVSGSGDITPSPLA